MLALPYIDAAGNFIDPTLVDTGGSPSGILTLGPGVDSVGDTLFPPPPVYTPIIPPAEVETISPIPNAASLSMEGIKSYWGVYVLMAAIGYNILSGDKYKKYNTPVLIAGGLGFVYWAVTRKPIAADPTLITPTT
jgi:hypothetical protein